MRKSLRTLIAMLLIAGLAIVAVTQLTAIDQGHADLPSVATSPRQLGAVSSAALINFTPAIMQALHRVLDPVRQGRASRIIAFAGDSKTVGQGAAPPGSATSSTGAFPYSISAVIGQRLAAAGIPTRQSSWAGDKNLFGASRGAITLSNYDSRISLGARWEPPAGRVYTLGGKFFQNTTTTSSFGFAPTESFDNLCLLTLQAGDLGTLAVRVDGGQVGVVNENGPTAFIRTCFAVRRGVHHISVAPSIVSKVCLVGIETSDSKAPALDVINLGAAAWRGGVEWAANDAPWDPARALSSPALAADIVVIWLGTNDAGFGNIPAFQSGLATMVANLRRAGKFIILVTPDSNNGAPIAKQEQLRAAILTVAGTSIPIIDAYRFLGTYPQRSTAPSEFFDPVHLNRRGYERVGAMLASALQR